MEDSEARRDRLKAMRVEAEASSDVNASGGLPLPAALTSPLLDGPSKTGTRGSPWFDFCTGMNRNHPPAHSTHGNNFIPPGHRGPPGSWAPPRWAGPRNWIPTSTPPYIQGHQPVNQVMYQDPYNGVTSYESQGGIGRPFPFHQGPPPPPHSDSATNYGSRPHGGMTGPSSIYQGNTNYGPRPGVNHELRKATRMGTNPRPRSGYGSHPVPSAGRGQGQFHGGNRSQGFGHHGGKGRSFHNNHGSTSNGRMEAAQFYHTSMVEDPWEGLGPIVWKGIGSSQSWMPRFIATKEAPSFRTCYKI